MQTVKNFFNKLFKRNDPTEPNIPSESKWRLVEDTLRAKYKIQTAPGLNQNIVDPNNLIPIIERVPPHEVVGILLQTIHHLQEDTDKGRSLAQKVVAKYSSKPVVVKKKVIKSENEGAEETVEFTSFSRQELAELRKLLIKGELTDIEWLVKIYELGGHTSMLSADELTAVIDTIELAKLNTALKETAEQHSNTVRSL